MADRASVVVDELKSLRKGFGVFDVKISERIGPHLRGLCGTTPSDEPSAVCHAVVAMIRTCLAELPQHIAVLCTEALNLDGSAERYERRVQRRAEHMGFEARTAKRRFDAALTTLAASLVARASRVEEPTGDPWRVTELDVAVVLTERCVEVVERRVVVANRPGTKRIDHAVTMMSATGGPVAAPEVDVLRGAVLEQVDRVSSHRFLCMLRLPDALAVGKPHEIHLRFRIARELLPYYVCTPKHQCARFSVSVKFAAMSVPERIWCYDGEFPLELTDPWPTRKSLEPDASGEVAVEFHDLTPNLSYGVGWS
jgi:hypothetical protein